MSELSKGWVDASLEEVVLFKKGTKPKILIDQKKDGFIPYIDIRAFEKNEIRQFAEVGSSKITTKSDILVVWDGARCGLVGMGKEGAIGSTIMCLTPIELYPKYLYHFLKTEYDNINSDNKGTGIPHVKSELFWNLQVPLAPINEQKRIIEKLDKLLARVEEAKDRLDKIPVLIKRFRQSVLNAAVTGVLTKDWREEQGEKNSIECLIQLKTIRKQKWEIDQKAKTIKRNYTEPVDSSEENLLEIPSSWIWTSVDTVCSQITDGEHVQPPYQEDGFPMLSAKHVRDGFVSFQDAKNISESDYKKSVERCMPEINDILIVSVGATTGRSAIVTEDKRFAIVRSVLLLKPIIPSLFLLRWLQCPRTLGWMFSASGASAQPHLYIKDTKRMPIPLPSIKEQKEIVKRVEALFKTADEIEERYKKANAYVDKLTQSILAKAFRGELVPQDPNDEPAEKLLERIREGKKKLISSKEKKKKKK